MTNSNIHCRLFMFLVVALLPAILINTADAQKEQTKQRPTKEKTSVVTGLVYPNNNSIFSEIIFSPIGAHMVSVGDTLRSQLSLPSDRGVVVTRVTKKGAADEAGLKVDDIVISAGDKPIRKLADLNAIIQASAGKKVKLAVIQEGKRTSLEIGIPQSDYTIAPGAFLFSLLQDSGHYIGVTVVPVDRALRSHLRIAKDQGVVVTDVVKDSPAAKAGFLKHDILLSVGDKPLGNLDDLHEVVMAAAGKPLSIKLLRSGERQTLNVTPEKRPQQTPTISFREYAALKYWHATKQGQLIRESTITKYPAVAITEYPAVAITEYPAVAITKYPAVAITKYPAVAITEYPAVSLLYKSGLTRLRLKNDVGIKGKLDGMIKQIEQLQKSLEELRKRLPSKTGK